MKKVWLFSTYKFQGNPKYLFLYILNNRKDIEATWIADDTAQKNKLISLGYPVLDRKEELALNLYKRANVYVVENYRNWIPFSLNTNCTILNLWHGVGLKHIELGLPENSMLSKEIASKWIRHYNIYKNNTTFLVTSDFMEEHFREEVKLGKHQVIRGGYPRNSLNKKSKKHISDETLSKIDSYNKIILFAPTYRETKKENIYSSILEIDEKLKTTLQENNFLFIFKAHHLDANDEVFQRIKSKNHENYFFWPEQEDIYEIFERIDIAIIDYSSIFYDLVESGVKKFIRYIPDYDEYLNTRGLKYDYLTNTAGYICKTANELLTKISSKKLKNSDIKQIKDKFLWHSLYSNLTPKQNAENIINSANLYSPEKKPLKTLHSFDIFDTLLQRRHVTPDSIFYEMKKTLNSINLELEDEFISNYVEIRTSAEHDIRETFKRTNIERKTTTNEITILDIYNKIKEVYQITEEQKEKLISLEEQLEIKNSLPILSNINRAVSLATETENNKVILISDMYLNKKTIIEMLKKANPVLAELPLFLSSEIGHTKSNGNIYKHIFYNGNYNYKEWIHYGDNYQSDLVEAKKYSIQPRHHHKNEFNNLEKEIILNFKSFEAYQIASLWNKKKQSLLDKKSYTFSEEEYFIYTYIAPLITPYVSWLVSNAYKNKYKTIYFISRDGVFLKAVADIIIKEKSLDIKTKLIYGSRKAWRLAGQDNKIDDFLFSRLGFFTTDTPTFSKLVENSHFTTTELIEIAPELKIYLNSENITNNDIQLISGLLAKNIKFKEKLLEKSIIKRQITADYLTNTINFNEKFCFAEYWGRGYTQDCLHNILKHTGRHTKTTDFYYIKSYYPSNENCIRNKYLTSKNYFVFIEPIFSSAPIKSVTKYVKENGFVTPLIIKNRNTIYRNIKKNLLNFTKDYIAAGLTDNHYFGRSLTNFMADYHIKNPNDYFICKTFSEIKNQTGDKDSLPLNISPPFTPNEIKNNDINSLRKLTDNVRISLLNSTNEVKNLFFEKFDVQIKPSEVSRITNRFPYSKLENYLNPRNKQKIIAAKKIKTYSSINTNQENEAYYVYNSGEPIEILDTIWDSGGIPYFLTKHGFIESIKQNFI